jgi:aryl-alcohol dehydrogenase-like predicted oxidoreductase
VKYALLGSSGLIVSRLSLGALTFTAGNRPSPAVYKVEPRPAAELIGRALDAGVNFFDTADAYAYGESEVILGQALKGRRDGAVISTKVGTRTGPGLTQSGLSRRHILWSVDQSLRRLGSDWIDVYLVHAPDPLTPLEETLTTLDQVVRNGKVRYLGFSNWSAWMVAAACEIQRLKGLAPFTHGQMHYSLLGRDVERDLVPMMKHYGLGMTVWSPLAGGFLTGKYRPENLNSPENRIFGADLLPFDKTAGFELVEVMRDIATRHRASVAQVALAWLLARQSVSSVILGAAKLIQLEDNLAAATLELARDELAELDTRTSLPTSYPEWFHRFAADSTALAALGRTGAEN